VSAFGSAVCTQEEELAALMAAKAPARRKMPPKGVPAPAATQPTPTHVMTMNYAVFRQALGMLAALKQPDEDAPVAFRMLVENSVQPYLQSPKLTFDPCAPRPVFRVFSVVFPVHCRANSSRPLRARENVHTRFPVEWGVYRLTFAS
jgi:hypothetical protein